MKNKPSKKPSKATKTSKTTKTATVPKKSKKVVLETEPLQTKAGRIFKKVWHWFILPALVFTTLFFMFQPHYLGNFSKGFYLDKGDGYQNVWNIWWVNEAITEDGVSPYHTTELEWPYGTTLVPQTMNIFNGLTGIPLMDGLGFSLIEATNFAVVFSFVMSGVTMFWFIKKLHGKYWIAIIAGALYTFSSYHFAHGIGHLQLVSMEWIPLFLLAFWTMVEKFRYRDAFFASGALLLVLSTDYYYLMWSVMLGAMWFAWKLYKKEIKLNKKVLKVLALFVALCALLVGPLMFQLFMLSGGDKLLGSHDARLFSLDPLVVFIPGGAWHWAKLTSWHWRHLPYASEMHVFFGYALLSVLAIGLFKGRKLKAPSWLNFWWIVLLIFGVLSMGPRITSFGQTIEKIPLPYALLEHIMPSLKISGMPVRWILIVLIAAIVIVSFVLTKLDITTKKGRILLAVFVGFSFIELYPMRLPLSFPDKNPYVEFLKTQPRGGVIDNAALSGSEQLYHQTEHEFPIAFGYVTRLPREVDDKNFHIFAALEEFRYADFCSKYKIRYITIPPSRPLKTTDFPIIYQDDRALIYDMKNSSDC